jgi:hypothetical protein
VTDKELDDIENRLNAATPGLWTYKYGFNQRTGCEDTYLVSAPPQYEFQTHDDWWRTVERCGRVAGRSHGDATFIAHAHQDIPALLKEVRRARLAARMLLGAE